MKPSGRYVMLTKEGGYYLLVLLFIIGGAVLREVNLLVVLAGLMIGPLVFSWRWVLATIADLTVSRQLPRRIAAGDPLVVELTVANRRRWLTSWAISVTDRLVRELPPDTEDSTAVEVSVARIPPGEAAVASYRCLITRRGRYRFGPAQLACRFPFGLVRASQRVDCHETLIVAPRLGRLTRRWEQWTDPRRIGSEQSSQRRSPVEGDFYGLRPWRSGDSRRWIHWRTTARLNEISVRQFEQGRNAAVALLIDLWTPPTATQAWQGHVEVAVSLAATAVAHLCRGGGVNLAIALHSQAPRQWSAAAGTTLAQDVLDELATAQPARSDLLPTSLEYLLAAATAGTRLIVLSTRSVDIGGFLAEAPNLSGGVAQAAVASAIWLDVTRQDLGEVFTLD